MVLQGKVVGGKIVLDEDVSLPEGAVVRIALAEESFEIDPELKPHLRKSRDEISRGDVIDYNELSAELDRDA
jgi:hypothetical protein